MFNFLSLLFTSLWKVVLMNIAFYFLYDKVPKGSQFDICYFWHKPMIVLCNGHLLCTPSLSSHTEILTAKAY